MYRYFCEVFRLDEEQELQVEVSVKNALEKEVL